MIDEPCVYCGKNIGDCYCDDCGDDGYCELCLSLSGACPNCDEDWKEIRDKEIGEKLT